MCARTKEERGTEMKHIQKGLALWLCLCLLLSLPAGCGKGREEESRTYGSDTAGNAGHTEGTPAPAESSTEAEDEFLYVPSFQLLEGINSLGPEASLCGDTLYTERRVYESQGNDYRYELWSLNLNTLEAKQLTCSLEEGEYMAKLTKLADGTLVLLTMTRGGELSQGESRYFWCFAGRAGRSLSGRM